MLQPQQTLQNRYRLQKQLGNNPTRQTWIAEDIESQQQVVVKFLPFSPQTQWQDVKLFEREAQVLQHLNHPCIPRYLDYFSIEKEAGGGLPWFALVQEYIPGSSLQQLLKEGQKFTEAETKEIAKQLLEILIHLHELSPPILHRDIKPSNLIALSSEVENSHQPSLTASPRPRVSVSASPRQLATSYYLVDFGAVQERAKAEGVTFTVVGTGGYAPPEQLWGKAVAASDLYALGATLVHLLTGIAPGKLPQRKMRLQFRDKVNLSLEFARWLDKLIDPAVEKRFGQARQALEALKAIEKEEKAEKVSFGRLGRLALMQYGVVGLCALALPLFAAYRYIHEGRIAVEKMNHSQEDYLSKHDRFANSLEDLESGIGKKTQNYRYFKRSTYLYSLNYATPLYNSFPHTKDARKAQGYLGIVAIVSEDSKTGKVQTATAICETKKLWEKIEDDLKIVNGMIECPSSMKVLKKFGTIVVRDRAAKLAYNSLEAANKKKPDIAIRFATEIENSLIKERTLASIAPHLNTSQQHEQLLELIPSFPSEQFQYSALQSVAPKLKNERQIKFSLQIMQSSIDKENRQNILYAIANNLNKKGQLDTSLQFAQLLRNDEDKYDFMYAISDNIRTEKQLKKALKLTQSIQNEENRRTVIHQIARNLKTRQQFEIMLEFARSLHDNQVRLIDAIASSLQTEQQFEVMLEFAQSLQDDWTKAVVLSEIVEEIETEQQIDTVLQFLQSVRDDKYKSRVLYAIAKNLKSEAQINAILQFIQSLEDDEEKYSFLDRIADNVKTEQQIQKILQIVQSLKEDRKKYYILSEIGRNLKTDKQIEKVLQITQSFQEDWAKSHVLSEIAQNPKAEKHFDIILQIVQSFQNDGFKFDTLSVIAANLKTEQQIDQLLQMIQSFQDEEKRKRVLLAIVDNLKTESQIATALQISQAFEDNDNKYSIRAIACNFHTQQQLEIAITIAQSFQDDFNKSLTLKVMASNIETIQQLRTVLKFAQSLPESKEKQIFMNALKKNIAIRHQKNNFYLEKKYRLPLQ